MRFYLVKPYEAGHDNSTKNMIEGLYFESIHNKKTINGKYLEHEII